VLQFIQMTALVVFGVKKRAVTSGEMPYRGIEIGLAAPDYLPEDAFARPTQEGGVRGTRVSPDPIVYFVVQELR
jgi:hypothetical protein